ncbi:Lysozyme c-1 [Blattella germanica]|nr:Lysozyme c-1 [Blattella germanica]
MRRNIICFLTILVAALYCSEAKKFTPCEFANELKRNGLTDLGNWVCLAESESSLNTTKVGGPNRNKSLDYGIFQINNKYWCKEGEKGGDCKIRCEDLKDDSITDDIECAKLIYKRQGFKAWYGWRNKCQGSLPDLSKC